MITRRSFLGLFLAVPAIPRILGEVGAELPRLVGARRWMTYEQALKKALDNLATEREMAYLFGVEGPMKQIT